jgi:hypothetical protein
MLIAAQSVSPFNPCSVSQGARRVVCSARERVSTRGWLAASQQAVQTRAENGCCWKFASKCGKECAETLYMCSRARTKIKAKREPGIRGVICIIKYRRANVRARVSERASQSTVSEENKRSSRVRSGDGNFSLIFNQKIYFSEARPNPKSVVLEQNIFINPYLIKIIGKIKHSNISSLL